MKRDTAKTCGFMRVMNEQATVESDDRVCSFNALQSQPVLLSDSTATIHAYATMNLSDVHQLPHRSAFDPFQLAVKSLL